MCIVVKKISAVVCSIIFAVCMVTGAFCCGVYSADADTSSLMVSCEVEGSKVEGMQLSIYKIGLRKDEETFESYGAFEDYYSSINSLSAQMLTRLASTLENLVIIDQVEAEQVQVSDSDGKAVFDGLDAGMYLICGKKFKSGMYTYMAAPAIFEITEEHYGSQVVMDGKMSQKLTLAGTIVVNYLKKMWEGDTVGHRPDSITVDIYRDGEYVETVTLTEEDDWTYKWNAEDGEDWRVKEIGTPPNYMAIYSNNDTQHMIINQYSGGNTAGITPPVTTTPATPTTTTTTKTGSGGGTQPADTTTTVSTGVGQGENTGSQSTATGTAQAGSVTVSDKTGTATTASVSGGSGTVTTSYTGGSGSSDGTDTGASSGDVTGGTNVTTTSGDDSSGGGSVTVASSESVGGGSGGSGGGSSGGGNGGSSGGGSYGGGSSGGGSYYGGGNSGGSSGGSSYSVIEKLPQTGQLWWPVPILAFSGIILIGAGYRLRSKSNDYK